MGINDQILPKAWSLFPTEKVMIIRFCMKARIFIIDLTKSRMKV